MERRNFFLKKTKRQNHEKFFLIRVLNSHFLLYRVCAFHDFLANFLFWGSELRDSCIVCMVQKLIVNGDYYEILIEGRWLMIWLTVSIDSPREFFEVRPPWIFLKMASSVSYQECLLLSFHSSLYTQVISLKVLAKWLQPFFFVLSDKSINKGRKSMPFDWVKP